MRIRRRLRLSRIPVFATLATRLSLQSKSPPDRFETHRLIAQGIIPFSRSSPSSVLPPSVCPSEPNIDSKPIIQLRRGVGRVRLACAPERTYTTTIALRPFHFPQIWWCHNRATNGTGTGCGEAMRHAKRARIIWDYIPTLTDARVVQNSEKFDCSPDRHPTLG